MNDFIGKLEKIQKGEMLDVTLVLDDPCGNSYLQVKTNDLYRYF